MRDPRPGGRTRPGANGSATPPRGGAGQRGGAAPSRFPGCTRRSGCLATSPGHVARCPLSLRHLRSPAPGCAAASAAAAMNIFRLTGDLSHLAAIIILLLKIWKSRSCAGACGRPLGGRGEGGGTGRAAPAAVPEGSLVGGWARSSPSHRGVGGMRSLPPPFRDRCLRRAQPRRRGAGRGGSTLPYLPGRRPWKSGEKRGRGIIPP